MFKDQGTSTQLDGGDSPYEHFKSIIHDQIEHQNNRLDQAADNDEFFLDELEKRQKLFRLMRISLKFSSSEDEFFDKLNERFLDTIQKAAD